MKTAMVFIVCRHFGEPTRAVDVWAKLIQRGIKIDQILFTSYGINYLTLLIYFPTNCLLSVSACRQAKTPGPAFDALRKLPPTFRPDREVYLSLTGLIRDTKSSHLGIEVIDHAISRSVALDPAVLGADYYVYLLLLLYLLAS